jgi:Vacuolar sorting protein 9 (VPS9) domain
MFYTTHKNDSLLFQQGRIDKLIVRIIFEKTSIYTLFFTLIRLCFIDEELKLKSVHNKFTEITPKAFNVDDLYCLSDLEQPYQNVLEDINNLDSIMLPHDKFATISKMRRDVALCLDKYYETTQQNKEFKKKILLSAENVLPLFSYCIAASRNLKIRAHQVFIEEFVDDNLLKFGEEGYSFSTFIAATDYLVSLASYENEKRKKLSDSPSI